MFSIRTWTTAPRETSAPSMVPSQTIGELALIRLMMQVWLSRKSAPNNSFAISTVSAARSGWVTEPMNGLSL